MRRSSRSPLWRIGVDREVRDEMELHLEMRARDFEEQGMERDDAQRLARERFGDPEQYEVECRRLARQRDRRFRLRDWLDELRQDAHFLGRQFRLRPFLTLTVVGLLALGIAASVTAYGLVEAVVLRPPAFPEPDRLAILWEAQPQRGNLSNMVSPANFVAWQEESTLFERTAAFITVDANLTADGTTVRAATRLVTDGYFQILGREAQIGRTLISEDYAADAPGIVLSHELWQRRYGGQDEILGRELRINDKTYPVLGVMPPDFELDMGPGWRPYGDPADLWVALPADPRWRQPQGRWMMVVARLLPGATLSDAQAELAAIAARQRERFPDFNTGWETHVVTLQDQVTHEARLPLFALFAAVCLVLLIVCANSAGLLVGRGVTRRAEIDVRAALGAGRGRLCRQLFAEGAILAGLAGLAGLGIAALAARAVDHLLPTELTVPGGVPLDTRAIFFALALSAACALVFGLFPALQLLRRRSGTLRGGTVGSRSQRRLLGALVFAELALAVMLLAGAGLMLRTVGGLLQVDPGFDPRGTVTFGTSTPRGWQPAKTLSFYDTLLERLENLPSVARAGAASHLPMVSAGAATSYFPTDRPEPPAGEKTVADIRILRGDYLRAMDIPLRAGRTFNSGDHAEARPGVAMISESLARLHWPGESALGKRLVVNWGGGGEREIVGVVGDVHHAGLAAAARGTVYFPQAQEAQGGMSIVLRAEEPTALVPVARELVRELAPEVPIFAVRTLEEAVHGSVSERRFLAGVLGSFAALALVLAALGLYGITALSVAQRTREIGLRMALGASPDRVARQIVVRAAILIVAALAVGLAGTLYVGRFAEALLYGVVPSDPVSLAATSALLAVAAAVAVFLPARRAARVEPSVALRDA